MIIDGRNLNPGFNQFSTSPITYRAKSPEEAEALRNLIIDSGKKAKILHDYHPEQPILSSDVPLMPTLIKAVCSHSDKAFNKRRF